MREMDDSTASSAGHFSSVLSLARREMCHVQPDGCEEERAPLAGGKVYVRALHQWDWKSAGHQDFSGGIPLCKVSFTKREDENVQKNVWWHPPPALTRINVVAHGGARHAARVLRRTA